MASRPQLRRCVKVLSGLVEAVREIGVLVVGAGIVVGIIDGRRILEIEKIVIAVGFGNAKEMLRPMLL